GQTVTLTAAVTSSVSGAGTPSGSITFNEGSTALGSAALVNGQAVLSIATLAVGTHNITAVYSGASNFQPSISLSVMEIVNSLTGATQATNTVVFSSVDPIVSGQPVTFTAAVAPAASGVGIPTGTVTFTFDGVAQPAVSLSNGMGTLTVSTLSAGTHSVTA